MTRSTSPHRSKRHRRTMLILYHKHPTSARTRFLRFAHGGICDCGPLPPEADLTPPPALCTHPLLVLRAAAMNLGLPDDGLMPNASFRCGLRIGSHEEQVHLGQFAGIDPPIDQVTACGARFVDLVQARGQPPIELKLLRMAYEHVLG
ncbi:MAG: hypothetical protein VBE63_10695 [Lamprobacter sp.]|uniref:hypothetical protein n=1 Tax=Lamprobacter sp. TaxID=3100796 RepID=UPI002B258E77|nr:hypothetical protein [Lamprobacter sp.]MEA3640401.1 hypothetical protein [Lamprobacter sp.]